MENCFVVKTTLSKKDTLALAKQQLKKNKLFMALCAVLLVIGTIANWITDGDNKIIYTVLTVVLVVVSLFIDRLVGMLMYRNANQSVGETTYHISDANIFMKCAVQEGNIPYDAFTDLVESNDYFYLYIQKRSAFVLPKADFAEGSVDGFRDFISQKCGKPVRRVRG